MRFASAASLLLAGFVLASHPAAATKAPRTGTVEVKVTYSGQGGWNRPPQSSRHVLDRTLTYRIPLVGHYSPASGWKEIDARLPPSIEGQIPEQNMSAADIEDLSASVEAAEAACGGDEDCMVQRLMPKSQQLHASGKLVIPAQMPKGNMPDFERFLVIGTDCPKAVATLTAADRYDEMLIDAIEGGSGLRQHLYTIGGTKTLRGGTNDAQYCRFAAVLDTKTNSYSLQVPIWARLDAAHSTSGEARQVDFSGTGGSANLNQQLDARTRWLDLPMGPAGKSMIGRRVIDNVNRTDVKGTPIQATVEWKITLD